jgi:hypothetical protein
MSATKIAMRVGNQPSTAQANPKTPSPPETTPWIKLSDLNGQGDFWARVKTEFETIAGALPSGQTDDRQRERGELLIGEIATLTGFSISNGTLSFNAANANIGKFTYYMAFRLPFTAISVKENGKTVSKSFPGSFENWWKGANRIRVKHWQDATTPDPAIDRRLCKNGEREVWEQAGVVPTDENTPAIQSNTNTKESRYTDFGVRMHRRLKENFFTNGDSQVPLPYYLKAAVEAPFLSHWLRYCRSFPYNVTSDDGIPYPVSNFNKIIIKNIRELDAQNNLQPTSDFFHKPLGSVSNYRNFPKLGTVVSGNQIAALNGKLRIDAYRLTRVNVQIETTLAKSNYHERNYSIRDNGEVRISDPGTNGTSRLIKDSTGANNYNPDVFERVYFRGQVVYYDRAQDRNYVKELTPITLYADYVLVGGVQAGQLAGHRMYGATVNGVTEFSALIPESTAVGNYDNDGIEGASGLTIGIGIDLGQAVGNTDRRTSFENNILANNSPGWNGMTNTEKDIIRGVYGLQQQAAENYWLRNILLFDRLDLQTNASSYHNVLRDTIPFARQFYYNRALRAIQDKGLKTELNIAEEYAVLTLYYNRNASITQNAPALANAINKHSHAMLISVISLMTTNRSHDEVIAKLNSAPFKTYYNDNHYHNL